MTELGHLLVADELLLRLEWPEELRPYLYLGCISPDAYRVTTGVDYRDVHFRSASRPGSRLSDFLRVYLRPALAGVDGGAQAFFSGWLSHICADYVWRQRIRDSLPELWQIVTTGPRLESIAVKHEFYDEGDFVDGQLYFRSSTRLEEIRLILADAPVRYSVPPLQPGDIYRWRQRVVEELLPPGNYSVEEPRWLTRPMVEEIILASADEATGMLAWESKLATEQS